MHGRCLFLPLIAAHVPPLDRSTPRPLFGFTSCPDVCPTTLKTLGRDADKLNTVFISVDSERDTPEQLKLYLS